MMERSKTAINLFRQNRPMGGHLRLWTPASCNKSFWWKIFQMKKSNSKNIDYGLVVMTNGLVEHETK